MTDLSVNADQFNDNIKIYPHDKLLAWTILRLIPRWIQPNHLTVVRYLLTPLVLWYIIPGHYRIGLPLFLLVAFTDVLDGSLARTRRQITIWGIINDPIADKLLIGSLLAVLVVRHINPIIAFMVIGMEIIFVTGGIILKRRGVIQMANWWGKTKMIFQVLGVTFILLFLGSHLVVFKIIAELCLVAAIILAAMGVLKYGARFGS